jgi:hypothetical protein
LRTANEGQKENPVNSDPILSDVLRDLTAIRSWWSQHPAHDPPDSVVAYLAANQGALRFFIDQLYSITKQERAAIHSNHPELDESIIMDDGSSARSAVTQAVERFGGNKLADLTDDDVNMLLRAIAYVEYLDCAHYGEKLNLSPIRIL